MSCRHRQILIGNNLDQELQDILDKCSVSTRMVALTFFPERFDVPFSENVHGKIFDLIDGPAQKVAIAAPRGWGKTSIVAEALIARYIMFHLSEFIVYINMSHDAASLQTENLRRELVINKSIRTVFGPIRSRTTVEGEFEETFSKKAWVAYNTLVWPRGAGQQVRGVLFKNSRPGLIVIDDLEHPKEVESKEIREAQKKWFYADVLKAIPRIGIKRNNWKIVYIDTLKHEDSLLQHLMDSKDWATVRLEACDDNFKSTAPNFMSDKDIAEEWDTHVKAGETDVFFRELRNLPVSTKDASFQKDYFRYYNVSDVKNIRDIDLKKTDIDLQLDKNIENIVIVDPAKTVKMHSAESAITGWGIDLKHSKLYIRDIVSQKFYPDQLYEAIFSMALRLKATAIGIEETSLNEFIKQPIKNYMFKNGKFYTLIWLKPRGGEKKADRIRGLVPYYRSGYIYHNASCAMTRSLEAQLMMFPRSKLWDIMDCSAYVIQMLELGERYFSMEEIEDNDIESEYKELENEYEPAVSNWRTV